MRRYLDTQDAKSTGNMRKHAKVCWGDEAVSAADATATVTAARAALSKMTMKNGSITAAFQRSARSKVIYSHRQHTTVESRYDIISFCIEISSFRPHRVEFVRWISESKRPFKIVKDPGFRSLMKTGRPDCYIPSPETISRDVKKVFVAVRQRIAHMLQVSSYLMTAPYLFSELAGL